MKLSTDELQQVLSILEKIDAGKACPQLPDRVGRFLREYGTGRARLDEVLARSGAVRRSDGPLSGKGLQPIEVHPITDVTVTVHDFRLGESAGALVISEELGGVIDLTLWLKGSSATAAYNALREHGGVKLKGDYRWSPPSRITAGESASEPPQRPRHWSEARCLKAVAEDIQRPAHALEYVLDYRLGPPGIKFFRCVCAIRQQGGWRTLPGFDTGEGLDIQTILPQASAGLNEADLAALLVYREPWSQSWVVVNARPLSVPAVFEHVLAWADFRAELQGSILTPAQVLDAVRALRVAGVRVSRDQVPQLQRHLDPVALSTHRFLRGYDGQRPSAATAQAPHH